MQNPTTDRYCRPFGRIGTVGWIMITCLGLGAIPALVQLTFENIGLHRFALSALESAVYSTSIAVPCCIAIPRVMGYLDDRPLGLRLAAGISLLAIFSVTGCFVAILILMAVHLLEPAEFAMNFQWNLRICLLITFTFGVLSWCVATLQNRIESANAQLHMREIAEERERKIAADARFASLESRIHPHFLFNTLNSISALVREDPPEAERTIERLSALLRYSLDSEVAGVVALREELSVVRNYLEIEKVRFGDRLRYRIDADPAAESRQVPALSVQTLAENSVKYAVGARQEGAEIVISARVQNGSLRVEVSDDGPGFEPVSGIKPGHGLDLLRERLSSLFGSSASLEITARAGRTRVVISLIA